MKTGSVSRLLDGFPIVRSQDIDEASDRIGRVFSPHRLALGSGGGRLDVAHNQVRLRDVSLNVLHYGAEVVIVTDAASNTAAGAEATATPKLAAKATATPDTTPTPTPINEGISPTTGRPLPESAVYRPVLVAIDNAAQARPQTALMP